MFRPGADLNVWCDHSNYGFRLRGLQPCPALFIEASWNLDRQSSVTTACCLPALFSMIARYAKRRMHQREVLILDLVQRPPLSNTRGQQA